MVSQNKYVRLGQNAASCLVLTATYPNANNVHCCRANGRETPLVGGVLMYLRCPLRNQILSTGSTNERHHTRYCIIPAGTADITHFSAGSCVGSYFVKQKRQNVPPKTISEFFSLDLKGYSYARWSDMRVSVYRPSLSLFVTYIWYLVPYVSRDME